MCRKLLHNEGPFPQHAVPHSWKVYNERFGVERGLFFLDGKEWWRYVCLSVHLFVGLSQWCTGVENPDKFPGGSPYFEFYCIFIEKFFDNLPLYPPSPLPPLCASMAVYLFVSQFCWTTDYKNNSSIL